MNETPAQYNNTAVAGRHECVVMPPDCEVVAIRYRDNSTGDGDIYNCIAYVSEGKWFCPESCQPLLEYVGDEILEWWALKPGTGNKVA